MSDEVEIQRRDFGVRVSSSDVHAWIDLATFSQPLRPEISIDTLTEFDCSIRASLDGVQAHGYDRVSWSAKSTLWTKRYHLDVFADHMEFHAEVHGTGDLDAIRFFDSIPADNFRPHATSIKHFNDKGQTGARSYSVGSPARFRRVFCPEPNSYARHEFQPYEYAQISVNSDLDYCGGNFVSNPAVMCFAVAMDPGREWLAFGLGVEGGEYLFSEYEYLGGEDFALNLNSWGARRIDGTFLTPKMVIIPGVSAEGSLARYVDVLRAKGSVPRTGRDQPGWWRRPIVCGWGHQCYQADLFRIRSSPERPVDNAAYTLSTQANYRDLVRRLDDKDLPWGTLVIDARWFLAGGLKNVDIGRWPDLRGFIEDQHRHGRRVLLWWGPWDPEGVLAEQCVRFWPYDQPTRQNRPGRLAKFGVPTPGKKLAVDITLPAVRERIRNQVRVLLGSGPNGFNADGFKIDHMSAVPGIYGMTFPEGSRKLFGIEAVREYLAVLYETAKEVKGDALLIGQSPNPYLSDLQDMLRLGDVYTPGPDSVASEMVFRSRMAQIADPGWLIDTDGWPIPSMAAFREYVELQPDLGVPSLYYATHLDTTAEAFTAEDFARIRRAWSRV